MVHARQIADVVAIQDNLTCQLIHVLLDLVVLNHDDYEVDSRQELIQPSAPWRGAVPGSPATEGSVTLSYHRHSLYK